jgi:hypothetical protein
MLKRAAISGCRMPCSWYIRATLVTRPIFAVGRRIAGATASSGMGDPIWYGRRGRRGAELPRARPAVVSGV